MSDNGYYWRNRDRLRAWQRDYYRNLPKKKKLASNAASNARKKHSERLSFAPCALSQAWK